MKITVEFPDDPASEAKLDAILTQLAELRALMADVPGAVASLMTAVAAMQGRIVDDVDHLRDLLQQALDTDAANAAEVARLQGEADAAVASINEAISTVNTVDPDASFPPQ